MRKYIEDWKERRWGRALRRVLYPEGIFGRQSKPTRAGYAYFVATALVMTAAFNTGNNMLFLVLGLMLAALIASFMISEYMIADLYVRREAPATVEAGAGFTVAYYVKNKKRVTPSLAVRIRDRISSAEVTALAVYVSAGEELKVRGPCVLDGRGRARFGEMVISTTAPFGFMMKQRRAKVAGETVVLPRSDASSVDRRELASAGDSRPRPRRGRGEELFGFRDYHRGDPLKDVHWKTTARTGSLTVREREAEEERRLRVVLKIAVKVARAKQLAIPAARADQLVERAAAVARAAVEDGWRVRVETGGKGVDFGSGPEHLRRILFFLALFDDPDQPAGQALPPTDVEAMVIA